LKISYSAGKSLILQRFDRHNKETLFTVTSFCCILPNWAGMQSQKLGVQHPLCGWPQKVSYRTLSISSLNTDQFSHFFSPRRNLLLIGIGMHTTYTSSYSSKIVKIGQYLAKIWIRMIAYFLGPPHCIGVEHGILGNVRFTGNLFCPLLLYPSYLSNSS